MSYEMSEYKREEAARKAKWLTDVDCALIEAKVRRDFSWCSGTEMSGRIANEYGRIAREIEWSQSELLDWAMNALRLLTEDSSLSLGLALPDWRERVEAKLAEAEEDATEEWPVDPDMHALVRRWLAVSPYTIYRFRVYVMEAAAEAAKDAVFDLMFEQNAPSIARATAAAAKKWIRAWEQEGKIL